VLSKAGLETIGVETETFAIARSLLSADEMAPTTLLVNINMDSITFTLVTGGEIVLVQTINTGGRAFDRAVAAELGIDDGQAEEYKRVYGLDQSKLDGKVFKALTPLVDVVVNEIKKITAYRLSRAPQDQIKRLVIAGTGSLISGLVPYLTEALTIETQMGDPFALIDIDPQKSERIGELRPIFATAVGLAMKLS
jgi:type IV pilus assembly protein PilM